jgi:hypothetical protein
MHAPTGIFGVVAGLAMLVAPVSARTWAGGVDMNEACRLAYGDGWSGVLSGSSAASNSRRHFPPILIVFQSKGLPLGPE